MLGLTARELKRTGVFIHREIMKLQLAFCVDGHPEERQRQKTGLDGGAQGSPVALDPSLSRPWSTLWVHKTHYCFYHRMHFFFFAQENLRHWLEARWYGITLDCTVDVWNPSKWQKCFIMRIEHAFPRHQWGHGSKACLLQKSEVLSYDHLTSQYTRCSGETRMSFFHLLPFLNQD